MARYGIDGLMTYGQRVINACFKLLYFWQEIGRLRHKKWRKLALFGDTQETSKHLILLLLAFIACYRCPDRQIISNAVHRENG